MTAVVSLSQESAGAAAARAAVRTACAGHEHEPDVVLLFSTHGHDPRALLEAAREVTAAHVVGCSASGVLAGAVEVEEGPGVAAMALSGDERLVPFLSRNPTEVPAPGDRGLALVLADGYGRHPDELVRDASRTWPGWAIAGAVTTGPDGAFPAHRWLDDEVSAGGIAGLLVGAPAVLGVTQACRPVGPAHTITRAAGRVVAEIDGRRAFDVFADRARPLLDDLGRAAQSVLLAVPDDPEDRDVDEGYVVRGILRFDPERGLLALSSLLAEGMRFRFAVRDAYAAREDLRRMVADVERRLEGRRPRYGFYFSGAGRGRALYGVEDHDVSYLRSTLGDFPLVGVFTGGEIGPAALRPRLHLFAGVLAVVP